MTKKHNEYAEKVIKFVLTREEKELAELTVEKISTILDLSQSHVYHTFKQQKQMTPGEFLSTIKMIRAVLILDKNSDISIKSLSKKLGFSSPDYFNKIFKEHFGTTPGRYKKYIKLGRCESPLQVGCDDRPTHGE